MLSRLRRATAWGGSACLAGALVTLPLSPSSSAPETDDAVATTVSARPSTAAPAARRKAKKGLRVKVRIGGPKAIRKHIRVVVKGPRQPGARKKFKRTIRKTTTWPGLRPGRYRIKVKKVRFHDQRLKTWVSKKKVRIKPNRARKVSKVKVLRPRYCYHSGHGASRLFAWGDNAQGQLGTPTRVDSAVPKRNKWLYGAEAVTGTDASVVARCGDGTVWTWGANSQGELGIGDTRSRVWPVQVKRIQRIHEVAAGSRTAYARDADGAVWAWGSGRYGELGNGASGFGTRAERAVQVRLPRPAVAIAAGGHTAYAVLDNGTVAVWGNGGVGQRGNGTTGESTPVPVVVPGLTDIVAIAAGHATVYALRADSRVMAWGNNNQSQIPYTTPSTITTPLQIADNGQQIGASGDAGYLSMLTGQVYGWGSGRHHDVGFDNAGNPTVPRFIEPLSSSAAQVSVFAGKGHTGFALTTSGVVWSWGDNGQGQAGTGAPLSSPAATSGLLPARVTALSGVQAIGAGKVNGYAIR